MLKGEPLARRRLPKLTRYLSLGPTTLLQEAGCSCGHLHAFVAPVFEAAGAPCKADQEGAASCLSKLDALCLMKVKFIDPSRACSLPQLLPAHISRTQENGDRSDSWRGHAILLSATARRAAE